jgi:type II secretory pathway pseudopilin PulG
METVVVIFLMAMMSTLAMASYQGGRENARVHSAALEVLATLREAQQHALSGTVEGAPAYGVRLYNSALDSSKLSYPVYVDTNDNQLYDEGVDGLLATPSPSHSSDIVFTTYCVSFPHSWIDITFKPPHPNVNVMTSTEVPSVCLPFQKACVKISKGSHAWWVYTDTRVGVTNIKANRPGDTCNNI